MKTVRHISCILFFSLIFSGLMGVSSPIFAANTNENTSSTAKSATTINTMKENPTYWISYLKENLTSASSDEVQRTFTDEMISNPDYWPNQIKQNIQNEDSIIAQMEHDTYYWIHFINNDEVSI